MPGVFSINNAKPIYEGKDRLRYILPKPITPIKTLEIPIPPPPLITEVWGRADKEARLAKSFIYWNPSMKGNCKEAAEATNPRPKKRGLDSKETPRKIKGVPRKRKRVIDDKKQKGGEYEKYGKWSLNRMDV